MAVGAQQVGEQVGVRGIALGAVAAIARPGGLDDVGMDRHDREAGSISASTIRPEGRSMAIGQLRRRRARSGAVARASSRKPSASCATSKRSRSRRCSSMTHTACVRAGPVQSGKAKFHGQPPVSWSMTCRAGSPRGTLIDRRSGSYTLALHPVARLGLPAPRALSRCGAAGSPDAGAEEPPALRPTSPPASCRRSRSACRSRRSSSIVKRPNWTEGVYGGEMRMLMAKDRDIRMMVVYGYSRLVGYDEQLQHRPRHPRARRQRRQPRLHAASAPRTQMVRRPAVHRGGLPLLLGGRRQQPGPVAVRPAAGAAGARPAARASRC